MNVAKDELDHCEKIRKNIQISCQKRSDPDTVQLIRILSFNLA